MISFVRALCAAAIVSLLAQSVWAASEVLPVATWTDFNNLTSGSYTWTLEEGNTINADGSLTVAADHALSMTLTSGAIYSNRRVTIELDVSGVPTTAKHNIAEFSVYGNNWVRLDTDNNGYLKQHWTNDGNYGAYQYSDSINGVTAAGRHKIALAYSGNRNGGTRTFINGNQVMVHLGLVSTAGNIYAIRAGAAGMTIHGIKLYEDIVDSYDELGKRPAHWWTFDESQNGYKGLNRITDYSFGDLGIVANGVHNGQKGKAISPTKPPYIGNHMGCTSSHTIVGSFMVDPATASSGKAIPLFSRGNSVTGYGIAVDATDIIFCKRSNPFTDVIPDGETEAVTIIRKPHGLGDNIKTDFHSYALVVDNTNKKIHVYIDGEEKILAGYTAFIGSQVGFGYFGTYQGDGGWNSYIVRPSFTTANAIDDLRIYNSECLSADDLKIIAQTTYTQENGKKVLDIGPWDNNTTDTLYTTSLSAGNVMAMFNLDDLTVKLDAPCAEYSIGSGWLSVIKASDKHFLFKGSESNGVTMAYSGNQNVALKNHLEFLGGVHNLTWNNENSSVRFGAGATPENPTILVNDDTTLNFTGHNLCGWNAGSADTEGIIRINNGGTLNMTNSGGTVYWVQQFYLEPGAEFNFADNADDGSNLRLIGGEHENAAQIYVPASESDTTSTPAVFTMTRGGSMVSVNEGWNSDNGFAVYVGNNSKLELNSSISGAKAVSKFGEGVLKLTKASSFTGGLNIRGGVVDAAHTTEDARYKNNNTLGNGTVTIYNNAKIMTSGAYDAHSPFIKNLVLESDATIEGYGNSVSPFGISWNQEQTSLSLNSHTLTINTNGRFCLDKTSIASAGIIDIVKGYLFIHCGSIAAPEGTKIVIGNEASIEADNQSLSVPELEYNGTVVPGASDRCMVTVTSKVSGTGTIQRLTLTDGATVDGSLTVGETAIFGSTVKLAEDAKITVPDSTTLPMVVDADGKILGTLASGSATITTSVAASAINALNVTEATIADGVALSLDEALNTITIHGNVSLAKADGSWIGGASLIANATFDSTVVNPWANTAVTETYFDDKDPSFWKNVFGGPFSGAVEAGDASDVKQWVKLENEDVAVAPLVSNSGRWGATLFDGSLMPNVTTKSVNVGQIEGWSLRMGVVSGAKVTAAKLVKFQDDSATPMFVGVDAESKLTINNYGNGNCNRDVVIDVASADGIEFKTGLGVDPQKQHNGAFEYIFRGNGTIKVNGEFNLGGSHKVKSVDIDLGSGDIKTIHRKALITFTSTNFTQTDFGFAESASVNTGDADHPGSVAEGILTVDSPIGAARIVRENDGMYVEWMGFSNNYPSYYSWEFAPSAITAWGAENAWVGLLVGRNAYKTWSENMGKTEETKNNDLYFNYAKDFRFTFDASKSAGVVVDATVEASKEWNDTSVEGMPLATGNRYVILTNSSEEDKAFTFDCAISGEYTSNGVPLDGYDFSTAPVLKAPVDATTYHGNLGLRAAISGQITLGENAHIVFQAGSADQTTIAYDYNIVGRVGAIGVADVGTFLVPDKMYNVPFNLLDGGSVLYRVADGSKTLSAAVTGNGTVKKGGDGALVIDVPFTNAFAINGGTVVMPALADNSRPASISIAEGAKLKLVVTEEQKLTGYFASNVAENDKAKVVFVDADGDELTAFANDPRILPGTQKGWDSSNQNNPVISTNTPIFYEATLAAVLSDAYQLSAKLKVGEEVSAAEVAIGADGVITLTVGDKTIKLELTEAIDESAGFTTVYATLVDAFDDATVVEIKATPNAEVAMVGDKVYYSLTKAFAEAGVQVVVLTADVDAVKIPEGGKLDVNGHACTISGSGSVMMGNSTSKSYTIANDWVGTVVFEGLSNTADFTPSNYGNANSTVELIDCTVSHLSPNGNFAGTLKLTDKDGIALTMGNGYTRDTTGWVFGSLTGSGSYVDTNSDVHQQYTFNTAEVFEGTFTNKGKRIVIGTTAVGDSGNGKIIIQSGAIANVASGKTWTSNSGVEVAGTIKGSGTIGSSLSFANGATINLSNGALTATGAVTFGATLNVTGAAGTTVLKGTNFPATLPDISGDFVLVHANGEIQIAAAVAKIGEKRFATIQAAIDALTGEQNVTDITLIGDSVTSLPSGQEDYKIVNGVIVAKARYSITVTDDEHVAQTTIPASVREDEGNIAFTITPSVGYHVTKVMLGEAEILANGSREYVCTISANSVIVITTAIDTFTVTIPELANTEVAVSTGTIEEGKVVVDYGTDLTVTYTAKEGYIIADENGNEVSGVIALGTVTSDIEVAPNFSAALATATVTIPEAPANTIVSVTVDGVTVEVPADGVINATIGATVVVTYSAAEGYIMNDVMTTLTAGESTDITVPTATPIVAVAKIGERLYPTLQAAFTAGGEVTLLQDTTETLTIAAGKEVTLDLNGNTITSAKDAITVKGTLVVNSTGGSIVSTGSGRSAITTSGSGKVTIIDGTFTAVGTAISGNAVITGGTITSTGSFAAYANSSSGVLEISGGTITGAAAKGDVGIYTGNAKVTGVELANGIKFASNASGIILAGTDTTLFTPELGIYDGEELVGYAPAQTTGTVGAMAGKTVKLLKDCETTDYLKIAKSCTFDLNGHNLTTSAAAAIAISGASKTPSEVTIIGTGTISSTAADCNAIQVGGYAKVAIAGGTFKAPTDNAAIYIVTSYAANPSTVTVTGGTFESGDGEFTLNIKDDQVARGAAIVVKGGTFKNGFDPSNCVSEGAGTNFVAVGYEAKKDGPYYTVVPAVAAPEADAEGITPVYGGEEIVVKNADTKDEVEGKLPNTTALYDVESNGSIVGQIGVIAAKDAEEGMTADPVTTAVAVPFTGAMVANLLNTALLKDGDTLMAYITVGGKSGYAKWTLTDGAWIGDAMIGGIAAQPDTTALARGTAVWVTTAGKIVVLGKYDTTTEIAAPTTAETHLLANPKMEAYTPTVAAENDEVIIIGEEVAEDVTTVRYAKTSMGWKRHTFKKVANPFGGSAVGSKEVIDETAPSVPVGKGFWFMKK